MSHNTKMRVAVSVATVWTKSISPRPQDSPALQNPVDLEAWLRPMTVEERLELSDANRIQTQILYGTEVIIAQEDGEWVKVFIPGQKTHKESAGYPGWVPKKQLAEIHEQPSGNTWVEVISNKALLTFGDANHESIELSFLTRLPLLEEMNDKVMVDTPHGPGILQRTDIRIEGASTLQGSEEKNQGKRIVEQGKRFLGLHYLWGGMSSYGYDCSGFAYNMHRSQGIGLPRDASDQSRQGVEIDRANLEAGDLMFFEKDGRIHHVGIYAGDNKMIHSPNSKSKIELVDLDTYSMKDELCIARRYWS